MVSHPSEQLPTETQLDEERVPTVMYLIEIDSNQCTIRDGMSFQMLNSNQNNAHYLIPAQGVEQTGIQKHIQHHIDFQGINVIDNGSIIQNDVINEQQTPSKIPPHISYVRPVHKYVHIADSVPPPRAAATLPSALRICRGGVSPHKLLPPRIRFGPITGVVQEVSSKHALNLISKAAANKSNWFSLLPLGDESTANVWVYQDGDSLYGITTRSIAPRVNLCLGYSQRYAAQHRLPASQPVCGIDEEDEQRKWWCYECRFACKTAALLQRHMDEAHMGGKNNTRRRRYRCKNCALPFSRLFTLKRHMSIHCKSKTTKPDPPPQQETTPDSFLNSTPQEEERLPSDESFQNYTNNLDFSTNLFDTDRLSTLDISANSRSDLNFYSDKDDFLPGQSESIGNLVDDASAEPGQVNEEKEKDKATSVITCPHCQDTMSISLKNRHMRECRARTVSCACGERFRDRRRLQRHVHALHASASASVPSETISSEYSFKCDECQLNFKRRGMFVNHMWRSHGELSRAPLQRLERHYPCVACPKLYRSAAKRARHVRKHHPGAELMRAQTISSGPVQCAPATCPACPRQYATRAKMLQHARACHPHLIAPSPKKSHK
ncbi:PR domain zinc finger protein 10-like isoform X2 [Plodia interpunctella]|uniref:PR domain zinc finger protein 10-like isoform X2 n=1 Tax=Plodia interpunctella TaxID=58824 RepID=UPI0023687009|nr:PR domain zinc finger protein 10-like isoform X2 [Plodia interpunctella]